MVFHHYFHDDFYKLLFTFAAHNIIYYIKIIIIIKKSSKIITQYSIFVQAKTAFSNRIFYDLCLVIFLPLKTSSCIWYWVGCCIRGFTWWMYQTRHNSIQSNFIRSLLNYLCGTIERYIELPRRRRRIRTVFSFVIHFLCFLLLLLKIQSHPLVVCIYFMYTIRIYYYILYSRGDTRFPWAVLSTSLDQIENQYKFTRRHRKSSN